MPQARDLPQGEFEVMDVLWRLKQATVKEIHGAIGRRRKIAYTTVSTLLARLREKGLVAAEERNFAYVFRPLVRRDRVVRRKLDELVRNFLGGNLGPMAAYIAEKRDLTPEQIAALEGIVRSESGKKSNR